MTPGPLLRVMDFLRDRSWQAITALIALLALAASLYTRPQRTELSVIYSHSPELRDNWLPHERLQLLLRDTSRSFDDIQIDFFLISSLAGKPILPSDYMAPLRVSGVAKTRIVAVESCSESMAKMCLPDVTTGSPVLVSLEWKEVGGGWEATPALINPEEPSCAMVVSEKSDTQPKEIYKRLSWNARIAGIQLRTYTSMKEHTESHREWLDYLVINVTLPGVAILWFIITQLLLLTVAIRTAIAAQWLPRLSRPQVAAVLLFAVFSVTSAEIIVDIVVNRQEHIHPVTWPLLIIHLSIFLVAAVRIIKRL